MLIEVCIIWYKCTSSKIRFPIPLSFVYYYHHVRDRKSASKKKEIWLLLWASLFLGKWCGVATYFLYKYIYIYEKLNIYTRLNCSFIIDWIKQNIFEILKNYMALGPSYKLPKNYMAFCPSYKLPKIKIKTRLWSTYPKT